MYALNILKMNYLKEYIVSKLKEGVLSLQNCLLSDGHLGPQVIYRLHVRRLDGQLAGLGGLKTILAPVELFGRRHSPQSDSGRFGSLRPLPR